MAEQNNVAGTASSGATAPDVNREFVISRVFDAPRELVFTAWTEPERMSQWWGPPAFTCPVCEMDVRVGGAYRVVMRGSDGTDYPVKGVYREIAKPERLVMTMDCSEHPAAWHDMVNPNRKGDNNPAGEMLGTVTFEELGAKTRVTVRIRLQSAAVRDAMVKMGMNEGWSLSLDRLEKLLASTANTAGREIVVTRLFDAPRERVFDAWTDPEQVAQWWGPRGFTTTISEMNVRPGGVWRLVMHGPDGTDYKNRIVFQEVVKPERLVYQHEPEAGTEPGTHRSIVTFELEGAKTRVTMRLVFASAAARDYVVTKYNASEGGNQTIDRLGEHLAKETSPMK